LLEYSRIDYFLSEQLFKGIKTLAPKQKRYTMRSSSKGFRQKPNPKDCFDKLSIAFKAFLTHLAFK
jgi:hypothetical protein